MYKYSWWKPQSRRHRIFLRPSWPRGCGRYFVNMERFHPITQALLSHGEPAWWNCFAVFSFFQATLNNIPLTIPIPVRVAAWLTQSCVLFTCTVGQRSRNSGPVGPQRYIHLVLSYLPSNPNKWCSSKWPHIIHNWYGRCRRIHGYKAISPPETTLQSVHFFFFSSSFLDRPTTLLWLHQPRSWPLPSFQSYSQPTSMFKWELAETLSMILNGLMQIQETLLPSICEFLTTLTRLSMWL